MSDFQQTLTSLSLLHTSLYRMQLFQNAHAVKNVKTDVISIISRLEKAERERDELLQRMANREIEMEEEKRLHKEGASMLRGQYDDLAAAMGWLYEVAERQKVSQLEYARQLNRRVIDLEAEIARRDAAAGKPFAYVITDKDDREAGRPGSLSFRGVRAYKDDDVNEYELSEQPLYDSAPPAVLPDIDGYTHGLFPHAVEQLTRFRDDALALGAQQQKVVELDNVFSINVAGVPVRVILLKDVSISLGAAGVKWEVKK